VVFYIGINSDKFHINVMIYTFSRSTAPEYKQQNQTHSIKNSALKMTPSQKKHIKKQNLVGSAIAGATALAT
jgi:hypothetical protein